MSGPELTPDWVSGFKAACWLLSQDMVLDKYGIGNMMSQWTANDVAEDLESRMHEAWEAFNV